MLDVFGGLLNKGYSYIILLTDLSGLLYPGIVGGWNGDLGLYEFI